MQIKSNIIILYIDQQNILTNQHVTLKTVTWLKYFKKVKTINRRLFIIHQLFGLYFFRVTTLCGI